ncbi:transglutaminase domain-containing protein [Faecalimonas sp.]
MKRRKVMSICCTILTFSLLLTGCQTEKKSNVDAKKTKTEMTTSKQLSTKIKEKYADSQKYIYKDAIENVKRNEKIPVQFGFDIKNGQFKNYTELVAVYQDSELTQRVGTHFEWDEKTKMLKIKPPRWSTAQVSVTSKQLEQQEDLIFGHDKVSNILFNKDEFEDWGNLPQYYMALYVNPENGEKLEKPIVTPFTIKHEIEKAPEVKFRVNDNGKPEFYWEKVKGAKAYYIVQYDYDEKNGYNIVGMTRGITDKTSWSPESNIMFNTFTVAEVSRNEKWVVDKYGPGTGPVVTDYDLKEQKYCVVAVNEEGTSAISDSFSKHQLSKMIASNVEAKKSREEEGSRYAKSFTELPSYAWVTMCDGRLVQKLITYDIASAKEKTETWGEYEKPDMSDLKSVQVDIVKIPYQIEGTSFKDVAVVEKYNKETVKADLKALQERQESLRTKGGRADAKFEVKEEKEEKTEENIYATDYEITATSALSEYIGRNMVAGNTRINLSEFKEAKDQSQLLDAWQEATYQNPLALGVRSASISGDYLIVKYDDSPEEMRKKQAAIVKEVKKVVKEVIKDGMTELEKEIALNNYLCEIAKYDDNALKNAEKNNFKKVDKEFNDSFTPYGVLINKNGVCASYAGAYKLLAQEAGLECIVVTGYLEGNLPHAWNKVKVDGQWQIVDPTNNDNEILTNALLNLPNAEADRVLVEDDRYLVNAAIADYVAKEDTKEYYHINNKYFEKNAIANSLVKEVGTNGNATLRTEYGLTEEEFKQIAGQVVTGLGNNKLQGTYWLGVIYITK